ncbi:Uncharacterised protein [Candidatus Norongarragalina meridionalis]|nr:Uncharacterised protein [Candidatus Norongarragalina meridionalis]
MKFGSVLLGLAFVTASVAAINCWDDHPTSAWDYGAPLCRNNMLLGYSYSPSPGGTPFWGYVNGRITATNPSDSSVTYMIMLTAFTNSPPTYPATLKCYKRMQGSGSGYWWLYKATCVVGGGSSTNGCPSWAAAGCVWTGYPGLNDPPTNPQGPTIQIGWGGVNGIVGKALVARAARSR